jgi:hypothetical protein
MSETENEQTTPDETENGEGQEEAEADISEEATGNDPDTMPPNDAAAPTPAGAVEEGGPTVEDKAVNAANNEEKLNEDAQDV